MNIDKKLFRNAENESAFSLELYKNKTTGDLEYRSPNGIPIKVASKNGLNELESVVESLQNNSEYTDSVVTPYDGLQAYKLLFTVDGSTITSAALNFQLSYTDPAGFKWNTTVAMEFAVGAPSGVTSFVLEASSPNDVDIRYNDTTKLFYVFLNIGSLQADVTVNYDSANLASNVSLNPTYATSVDIGTFTNDNCYVLLKWAGLKLLSQAVYEFFPTPDQVFTYSGLNIFDQQGQAVVAKPGLGTSMVLLGPTGADISYQSEVSNNQTRLQTNESISRIYASDGGGTTLQVASDLANGYCIIDITNGVVAKSLKVSLTEGFVMDGLPVYADNAAALAGGLSAGALYSTATGEMRIVV